jgi:hypothetical protein
MQRFVPLLAAMVLTMAIPQMAGAAGKPFRAEATLATAVSSAVDHEIDGVKWRCEGEKCVGTAESRSSLDSLVRECRKVSAVVGQLKSYSSRGRDLAGNAVSPCNRGAKA